MPDSTTSGSRLPAPAGRPPVPGGPGGLERRSAVRVLPWWAYTLAAAVVIGLTAVAIWWLLGEAGSDAKLRIEAIRTALTVGLGAGGAFALLINARRQWLQEQAHLHAERTDTLNQAHQDRQHAHQERLAEAAERDATERRVTDLYNAAATQLGSDQAPVRLTALYTLERLANANPDHQQTIVNIICAYLRMPYTPPAAPDPANEQRQASRRYQAARTNTGTGATPATARDPYEERQVRLTAQRILHTHLQPDATPHWTNIDLDLTGATLLDFTLAGCHLNTATFTEANLKGDALFTRAAIGGDAGFDRAKIGGIAVFAGVEIGGNARFGGAEIGGDARFDRAKIGGGAGFDGAEIGREAVFGGAKIGSDAWFKEVKIGGGGVFAGVEIGGGAWFGGAEIGGGVFDGVEIGGGAWFDEAKIDGVVVFRAVEVGGALSLVSLGVADRSERHELPPGWRIEPGEGAAGRVVADGTPGG